MITTGTIVEMVSTSEVSNMFEMAPTCHYNVLI